MVLQMSFPLHHLVFIRAIALPSCICSGLFKNMKYKVEFWRHNIVMNENILWYSHEYKVKKLVSCLSTCVFPDKTT